MRHYYLGLAAKMRPLEVLRRTFAVGRERSRQDLTDYLAKRYHGKAVLTKNGRSALALAFKAYFRPGDAVLLNGFTCYAVYEAVRAAGLTPVWADIDAGDLNFTARTLEKALTPEVRGVVIQNTLGNPVDIAQIEHFCQKHHLVMIEDLAHSVGVKYPDGREAGTVGAATVLSFGKEKVIDATSGGAVVYQAPTFLRQQGRAKRAEPKEPTQEALLSDRLRSRFYPFFALTARALSYLHLNGVLMRALTALRWVEKSADNRLDLNRKIGKTEAKLALGELKALPRGGRRPLREFVLVKDRPAALKALRAQGYYFDGLWYERPVAPERYYERVHFPEADCPVAARVAAEIVNLPTYYSAAELRPARAILRHYQKGEKA